MLQRRGRISSSRLKLQFKLDDDQLEALTDELLYAHPQVIDDAGRGAIWTGTPEPVSTPSATPTRPRTGRPCRTPHLAEKILHSRSALEGERKRVTVLFADLTGNTDLIRDLDPEAAQPLLDTALQHMMEAVHRFEGTVNDVAGDGITSHVRCAHRPRGSRPAGLLRGPGDAGRAAARLRRGAAQGLEVLLRVGLGLRACWCGRSATTST